MIGAQCKKNQTNNEMKTTIAFRLTGGFSRVYGYNPIMMENEMDKRMEDDMEIR